MHSLLAEFPFSGVKGRGCGAGVGGGGGGGKGVWTGDDGRGEALAPVLLPLASTEQNGEPANRLSVIGIEMTVETGKINGAQFLKKDVNCTR